MHNLTLARYRFHFRVTQALRLPDYAGSTLRGAFGHALLQVSGLTPADREHKTPLFLQSPYARLFDPDSSAQKAETMNGIKNLPVPYVIEAPLVPARTYQEDEELSFDMVLMGDALEELAIVTLAWRRAFLRGIGNGDGKAELTRVEHCLPDSDTTIIYSEDQPIITEYNTAIVMPEFNQPQDIHLHLVTPLRLQQQGKVLGPREINARFFLRNLIRRVTLQTQQQHPAAYPLEQIRTLNALADTVKEDRRLKWQEWERFSSRQKQAMKLGGVIGRWHFQQVPVELLPFIYMGQWLHFGKETAFGLGKYNWVKKPWAPSPSLISVNNTHKESIDV